MNTVNFVDFASLDDGRPLKFKSISAAEFVADQSLDKEDTSAAGREKRYRVGYNHGFVEALQLVEWMFEAGYLRPKDVCNTLRLFAEREVHEWRSAWSSRMDLPPEYKVVPWRDMRRQVFERDGRYCAFCGATADLEIDHIHAVKDGGASELDNLRVLCGPCNRGRNHA